MLPNCIVNGVAKSGTTAVYHYLEEHPEIFMSRQKELNFFAFDAKEGRQDVQFPVKTQDRYEEFFKDGEGYRIRGEASPAYFRVPGTARRIYSLVPDVNLITTLRNPVDRAYSGYLMQLRNGKASRNLDDAFSSDKHWVRRGFYSECLDSYYRIFRKEQINIVLHEDFRENSADTMKSIYEFLQVDASFEPNTARSHNVGTVPKSLIAQKILVQKERVKKFIRPVTPEFAKKMLWKLEKLNQEAPKRLPVEYREKLMKLYKPDILKVQELIERDLRHWYQ